MLIKTLLFDLDNTLFDYDVAFEGFIERLGQRFQIDLLPEIDQIHLKNEKGYAPRVAFFDWLAETYALPESGEELWKLMQDGFSNYVLVTDSTKKMLKRFATQYKIAILTNGSSVNQRNKITRSGLGKIISEIYISGEMDFEKPDVEVFRLACKKLDTPTEQTLYIGDHWENDIEGAKNAGLKTCWVSHGSPIPSTKLDVCDYVIASLEELPPMLSLYD